MQDQPRETMPPPFPRGDDVVKGPAPPPFALTPNTVEQIPTIGALFPGP